MDPGPDKTSAPQRAGQLDEPFQFGMLPLFFLTAFFAALVLLGLEGARPQPRWQYGDGGRQLVIMGYALLAVAFAIATIASMVPRGRNDGTGS
jgi:hypothetical protein